MGITSDCRNNLLWSDSMSKKTYTSAHIDAVKGLREAFSWSIRKIAKETGTPKSVVGRWVKDPEVWKEKYRFNVPEKTKKGMSEKRRKSLEKFHKKVAKEKKVDPDKYKGLMLRYTEDDDWVPYS